jgi:hypothetical protein
MKTMLLTFVLVITFLAASNGLACDHGKAKEKATKKNTAAAAVEKNIRSQRASANSGSAVLLTGSYTKQNIRRAGRITDGANQVIILDRETIERSGASDVKQLLNQQGVH